MTTKEQTQMSKSSKQVTDFVEILCESEGTLFREREALLMEIWNLDKQRTRFQKECINKVISDGQKQAECEELFYRLKREEATIEVIMNMQCELQNMSSYRSPFQKECDVLMDKVKDSKTSEEIRKEVKRILELEARCEYLCALRDWRKFGVSLFQKHLKADCKDYDSIKRELESEVGRLDEKKTIVNRNLESYRQENEEDMEREAIEHTEKEW